MRPKKNLIVVEKDFFNLWFFSQKAILAQGKKRNRDVTMTKQKWLFLATVEEDRSKASKDVSSFDFDVDVDWQIDFRTGIIEPCFVPSGGSTGQGWTTSESSIIVLDWYPETKSRSYKNQHDILLYPEINQSEVGYSFERSILV